MSSSRFREFYDSPLAVYVMVLVCAGTVVFSMMYTDIPPLRTCYYFIASIFSLVLVKLARADSGVRIDYVQSGEAWAGILGALIIFFLVSDNRYLLFLSVWVSVLMYELYIHQLSRGRSSDRLMVGYAFGAMAVVAGVYLVLNGLRLDAVTAILSGICCTEHHAGWIIPVMVLLCTLLYAMERFFVYELLLFSQGEQYFSSGGYPYGKVKFLVLCLRSVSAAVVISFAGVLAGVSAISIMLPEREGVLQDGMTVLVVFSFINIAALMMTYLNTFSVLAAVVVVSYLLHLFGGRRVVNG
ncbi:MAG TPA: hypothetical protein PLT75_03440 [Spirochaetota bacterium]|nr:hypothetical protein [Spirochaetota bacterium]